ncbi:hypothetical protein E308F_30980 [Moorella sp. E308F]|nr:hypothetical protein E308F_30980 [Moorella sp. E308F]
MITGFSPQAFAKFCFGSTEKGYTGEVQYERVIK